MSHVDEGRLEAWIDRDRSGMSSEEAEAIAHHLESCVACSSLLAEVMRFRERASLILGGAHLDDRRIPDFEKVRARAGAANGGAEAAPRSTRPPLAAYAWAASLVVAIGLGWMTRDLLGPRSPANQVDSGLMREVAVLPPEVDGGDAPAGEGGEDERVALVPSAAEDMAAVPEPDGDAETGTGGDTIRAQIESAPPMIALSDIVVAGYSESRESASVTARTMNRSAPQPAAETLVGAGSPMPATPPLHLQSVAEATMTMSEASRRLGSPVVSIPGLEVLSVEVVGNVASATVQLRQRLPEGGILLLIESIDPLAGTDLENDPGVSSAQVRRGSIYVTGVAPISVEALQRLLDTAQ